MWQVDVVPTQCAQSGSLMLFTWSAWSNKSLLTGSSLDSVLECFVTSTTMRSVVVGMREFVSDGALQSPPIVARWTSKIVDWYVSTMLMHLLTLLTAYRVIHPPSVSLSAHVVRFWPYSAPAVVENWVSPPPPSPLKVYKSAKVYRVEDVGYKISYQA